MRIISKFSLLIILATTAGQVFSASEKDSAIMSSEQIELFQKNALFMKIPKLQDRQDSSGFILKKAMEKLDTLKTSEDKLSYAIAMNQQLDSGFHVNDNYFPLQWSKDKEYFDAFYMGLLFSINEEIKAGKKDTNSIVKEYENNFPFKIYDSDLLKIKEYEENLQR